MVRAHVLAALLFASFWVVLGFSVFFIAVRGGLGGARQTFQAQSFSARKFARAVFTIVLVGFGIAIPAVILIGNHDNANGQVGGLKLTAGEKQGRELFGLHCAVCHTLSAANAVGKVGPDLDTLTPTPTETLVLHTITYGCLQSPPSNAPQENCLGEGTMPADVLQGQQATDVAQFVARVAGKE
jgi:mono/diheme cytochrome c family protein